MKRLNSTLVAGAMLLMVLTACNNANQPEASNSSPAANSNPATDVSTAANTPTDAKATLAQMKQVLNETTAAVNAGKFDQAKQKFEQFDRNWEKIEDGVKDRSKDAYKQIEDGMDNVENSLKAAKPDKNQAIAALGSLSKTMDNYTKTLQ